MIRTVQAVFCLPLLLVVVEIPSLAQTTAAPIRRISAPESFYDDASITAPGSLGISLGYGYGSVTAGHDQSFPSFDLSLGVNTRLEVDASSGYARSKFESLRIAGLQDSYFGGKVLLVTQGKFRPAIAIKPEIEVLGEPSLANNLMAPKRLNFVSPLEIEKSSSWSRTYYTAGYHTRGIFFQSLVNELDLWSGFVPSVVVAYSRLTHELRTVSDFGLNRSRLDVLGSASFALGDGWSMYAGGGTSVGRTDPNSLKYEISVGIGFNVRLRRY